MKKFSKYHAIVLTLFVFAPIISLFIQFIFFTNDFIFWDQALRWWLFYSIGIRLVSAGLKQIFQPEFTAKKIFNINDSDVLIIVREIGVANLSIGSVGLLSFLNYSFRVPIAIVGMLYLGFAGLLHLFKGKKNNLESFAMLTDLSMAIWLAILIKI